MIIEHLVCGRGFNVTVKAQTCHVVDIVYPCFDTAGIPKRIHDGRYDMVQSEGLKKSEKGRGIPKEG